MPPPQQDIYMGDLSVQWDNIIGLEEAKKLVKEAVVYPMKVRCCLDLLPEGHGRKSIASIM